MKPQEQQQEQHKKYIKNDDSDEIVGDDIEQPHSQRMRPNPKSDVKTQNTFFYWPSLLQQVAKGSPQKDDSNNDNGDNGDDNDDIDDDDDEEKEEEDQEEEVDASDEASNNYNSLTTASDIRTHSTRRDDASSNAQNLQTDSSDNTIHTSTDDGQTQDAAIPGARRMPGRGQRLDIDNDSEEDEETESYDSTYAINSAAGSGNTPLIEAVRAVDNENEVRQLEERIQELEELVQTNEQSRDGQVLATVISRATPQLEAHGNSVGNTSSVWLTPKRTRQCIFLVCLIGLFNVAVILLIPSSARDSAMDGDAAVLSPTMVPSEFPTITPDPMKKILRSAANQLNITNFELLATDSPEYLAVSWLALDDPIGDELLSSTAEIDKRILQDRFVVAILYFATNGQSWRHQFGFLSGTSICTWTFGWQLSTFGDGIECNENGEVSGINLRTCCNTYA